MISAEFRAMGCRMAAFLDSGSPRAVAALKQAPAWFEKWEQALSRFRPDSDLNRLNAAAGTSTRVGLVLWEVVAASLDTARWTGGLVVPTILKSLEQEGYDRSFDLIQAGQPGGVNRQGAVWKDAPDGREPWREIGLDARRREIFLPAGVRLDLGGVAKGWAAHQAMQRLSAAGPALMDAGGDIAASGPRADGGRWPVAVADPLHLQDRLELLGLGSCGVATSGTDYRRWLKDGKWKHHIIDPRTGESAETDLVSVTVVGPDVLQAEAAAKAVLILGSQTGLDWLEDRPPFSGMLVQQDGRVVYSSGMSDYLWSDYAGTGSTDW